MEPSVATLPKQNAYQRMANLPSGVKEIFLLKLEYEQLSDICFNASLPTASVEDKKLASFCKDPNFWRDYLIEHGFILPETFPELIRYLQKKSSIKRSEAGTIRKMFFETEELSSIPDDLDDSHALSYDSFLGDIRRMKPDDPRRKRLERILIDYAYLIEQILIINTRRRGKSRTFVVNFQKPPIDTSNFAVENSKIRFEDLIANLVDLGALVVEPGDYWQGETKEIYKEIEEQEIAMIADFIKKGDLLFVYLWVDEFESILIPYYFDGEKLFLIVEENRRGYLPPEAIPFLQKHQIENREQLNNLYPGNDYLIGIISPETGDTLTLPWGDEFEIRL